MAVAHVSGQITTLLSGVREASRDTRAVSIELTSLSLCLEALRDYSRNIKYPNGLQHNLLAIMRNCDVVTRESLRCYKICYQGV